jgi:hypothetical protein
VVQGDGGTRGSSSKTVLRRPLEVLTLDTDVNMQVLETTVYWKDRIGMAVSLWIQRVLSISSTRSIVLVVNSLLSRTTAPISLSHAIQVC